MYVQRNEDGIIFAIYAVLQPGLAEEYLPVDHEEILEFYNRGDIR